MRVLNLIGHDDQPPSSNVLKPFLDSDGIDGILHYTLNDGYAGLNGRVWWVNGKPVISGRFSLWGEATNGPMLGVDGLVEKLKVLPKDARSTSGYSVIAVH